MNRYFVDTSFWKALVDRNDEKHKSASDYFFAIQQTAPTLFTSDAVFSETVTLLRMRPGLGFKISKKWGKSLINSEATTLLHLDETTFFESWAIFSKYKDKTFSFVDCSSFALMKKLNLSVALTFDRHFAEFGFESRP